MHVPNRPTGRSLLQGATVAVLMVALLGGDLTSAQTASPVASPETAVCDVEPRTLEELAQLAQTASTPAGDPDDGTIDPAQLDEGVAIDDQTRAEIESTLAAIDACSAAGDLARVLAHYTDDYIVREFLATEPVPIVPGTPSPVETTGTPEAFGATPTVQEARQLPDGQVVAQVERSGRTELMRFVEVDGRWLVDAVTVVSGGAGTPEAGAPDDVASLPPVQAAVADAASAAGVPVSEVTVVSVEPTVWPDSSLGCPQPDQFYAQVETPGFVVTLDVAGTEVMYHTDEGEAAVLCDGQ